MTRSESPDVYSSSPKKQDATSSSRQSQDGEPMMIESPLSSPTNTAQHRSIAPLVNSPLGEDDQDRILNSPSMEKIPEDSPMGPSSSHSRQTSANQSSLQYRKQSSGDLQGQTRRRQGRSSHRHPSFEYKETLDATTKHLEDGSRIINQYRLYGMIGQGAYGNVFQASLIHDPTEKFAIKEFSKTRLRKNLRAANLRKPTGRGGIRTRVGFAARGRRGSRRENQSNRSDNPHHEKIEEGDAVTEGISKMNVKDEGDNGGGSESMVKEDKDIPEEVQSKKHPDSKDPLGLIRHEIAILKKLDHPHVVELYEVLDDPSKDELYMVFEYCPDGRIIDVKLHEQVEPLEEEKARDYLVQIMLGIEYLHHNDIVHRDIKPDNILLKDDKKVCKIVDFGVSEMFMKPGDDTLQKSAGSPAFMSPELCSAHHGDFHGKYSDIWSMGITLYCMVVGRLPFDKSQFLELYEAITTEEPEYPAHLSNNCKELLKKLLKKDPKERITLSEMRQDAFVTKDGQVKITSEEENTSALVVEVTDEEVDCAIKKIASVFTLARAISKFKRAGSRASSTSSMGEIAGQWLQRGRELTQTSETENQKSDGNNGEKGRDDVSYQNLAAAHLAVGAQSTASAAKSIAISVLEKGNVISSPDEVGEDDEEEDDDDDEQKESGGERREEKRGYFGREDAQQEDKEKRQNLREGKDQENASGQDLLGKTTVSSPLSEDIPLPQNAAPAYDGHSEQATDEVKEQEED